MNAKESGGNDHSCTARRTVRPLANCKHNSLFYFIRNHYSKVYRQTVHRNPYYLCIKSLFMFSSNYFNSIQFRTGTFDLWRNLLWIASTGSLFFFQFFSLYNCVDSVNWFNWVNHRLFHSAFLSQLTCTPSSIVLSFAEWVLLRYELFVVASVERTMQSAMKCQLDMDSLSALLAAVFFRCRMIVVLIMKFVSIFVSVL